MAAVISDRPIRIGIVGDNELFRSILHSSLDRLPNLKVVAEAENGAEAIAMVEYLLPDWNQQHPNLFPWVWVCLAFDPADKLAALPRIGTNLRFDRLTSLRLYP